MKRSLTLKTLVLLTALLAMTLGASAGVSSVPLSDLEPGEGAVTLGGLTFSDFEASIFPGSPDLDDIAISLSQAAGFPNIVKVDFVGDWIPLPGEKMDTYMKFLVTADPGVSLLGASLSMFGGVAVGDAQISIAENIFALETDPPLLSLLTYTYPAVPLLDLFDSGTFAAQDSVWVYKDIYANSNEGLAHLSGFGQSFETDVPEPASISLLAVGALALLKRRRKK